MKYLFLSVWIFLFATGNIYSQQIIAKGQMPAVTNDGQSVYLVYGNGDSILFSASHDEGKSFSTPHLIHVLPGLAASHTRGPQIGVTSDGLLITACTNEGNVFSFALNKTGTLVKQARVNDVDTMAKENLMSLSADGDKAFAVWLDVRNGRNEIYGSISIDGGHAWSKNIRIYHSPDSSVCECCKPSVVLTGNNIYVMFRNWLDGNRDLYLITSTDGGKTFGDAEKLGTGSWPLKGCPMDGGGITVNKNGVSTVWNREGKIYANTPGEPEVQIGEGRSCTITSVDGKKVYAWVQNKQVIYLDNNNKKHTLGNGQLPVLKAIDKNYAICIWENDQTINKAIVKM
jgi:hypothetical protein